MMLLALHSSGTRLAAVGSDGREAKLAFYATLTRVNIPLRDKLELKNAVLFLSEHDFDPSKKAELVTQNWFAERYPSISYQC